MPEALLPRLLVACRLTLHGGPSPLLALLGAHHDPAFGALRQVRLLPAPPVVHPLGAVLPRVAGREPLLHDGLRGGRGLGDPAHPAPPRHGEPGHALCALEPTVGAPNA